MQCGLFLFLSANYGALQLIIIISILSESLTLGNYGRFTAENSAYVVCRCRLRKSVVIGVKIAPLRVEIIYRSHYAYLNNARIAHKMH